MTPEGTAAPEPCSVGVVIVNYNAGKHLLEAVASCRREGVDEIVCVDNSSSDGSPEDLLAVDPGVKLIRSPNLGLGAGNNVGARHLQTDVVFCLNPDTVLHVGAIESLRAAMDSDPSIAIAGPRLLNPDGTLYPSARSFPVLSNAIGHAIFAMVWKSNPWTRKYKRLNDDYEVRHEVDWLSGAAMFARRTAFESVNGFDDDYFMYMEDVDLCWRLGRNGWKMLYVPEARLTHFGGVSTAKMPYRMLKEHHKSAIRYNLRTTKGLQRCLMPLLAVGLALRLPIAWLDYYLIKRAK